MFKIGFTAHSEEDRSINESGVSTGVTVTPRKSVVRIHFPARNMTLSYYNDAFDLKRGDIVYVDGKLENLRGRVVDITYNFKIKLSDYKRVIGVADTNVSGEFHFAGSHFVTFDRTALPYEKVVTWFKAPEKEDEVYVGGKDDVAFRLDDLATMKVSAAGAGEGEKVRRAALRSGAHHRRFAGGGRVPIHGAGLLADDLRKKGKRSRRNTPNQ